MPLLLLLLLPLGIGTEKVVNPWKQFTATVEKTNYCISCMDIRRQILSQGFMLAESLRDSLNIHSSMGETSYKIYKQDYLSLAVSSWVNIVSENKALQHWLSAGGLPHQKPSFFVRRTLNVEASHTRYNRTSPVIEKIFNHPLSFALGIPWFPCSLSELGQPLREPTCPRGSSKCFSFTF